jgi:hypothetical protein
MTLTFDTMRATFEQPMAKLHGRWIDEYKFEAAEFGRVVYQPLAESLGLTVVSVPKSRTMSVVLATASGTRMLVSLTGRKFAVKIVK